ILIAAIGVAEAAMNVAMTPLTLRLIPRELLGRTLSLINPCIVAASLVGTALAGYIQSVVLYNFHLNVLGQTFRSVDTIYVAAGVTILLGGLFAVKALGRLGIGNYAAAPASTQE